MPRLRGFSTYTGVRPVCVKVLDVSDESARVLGPPGVAALRAAADRGPRLCVIGAGAPRALWWGCCVCGRGALSLKPSFLWSPGHLASRLVAIWILANEASLIHPWLRNVNPMLADLGAHVGSDSGLGALV